MRIENTEKYVQNNTVVLGFWWNNMIYEKCKDSFAVLLHQIPGDLS